MQLGDQVKHAGELIGVRTTVAHAATGPDPTHCQLKNIDEKLAQLLTKFSSIIIPNTLLHFQ